MQKREPKKSQGVPKETLKNNCLNDLVKALSDSIPDQNWTSLKENIIGDKYFQTGMVEQVKLLARNCINLHRGKPEELIKALAASPVEKIRGVAPNVASIAFADNVKQQLKWIKYCGALDGTWPREASCSMLHMLFINHGIGTILPMVKDWIKSDHEGHRRVVTEGIRPRLMMIPHIPELKKDPSPLYHVLTPLLDDSSLYVRKSVANCLNDVSKDNPQILLDWAKTWAQGVMSKERIFILNRALRTLVDEGSPKALKILGYTDPGKFDTTITKGFPKKVEINELLQIELLLKNPGKESAKVTALMVMEEPGKGNAMRISKYQLGKGDIKPGGEKVIKKRIHFVDKNRQPKIRGLYRCKVAVNGREIGDLEFRY